MTDTLTAACPSCRQEIGSLEGSLHRLDCPRCRVTYRREDGIWRFLSAERQAHYTRFLETYTCVRRAEGRGAEDAAHYLGLPEVPDDDPLAWQWRIRARTFAAFTDRVLPRLGEALRVLDLGAGNGWLSHRLARLGHLPCAADINIDPMDGLGAARHFSPSWPVVQGEYDRLPLAAAQFDVVLFNAGFHYSVDYHHTLKEALRMMRREGRVVILDSPIYRTETSGLKMVAERKADFVKRFGTPSDALPSREFLTWDVLAGFEGDLGLAFETVKVWYGLKWALRPVRAALKGRREPSRFAILVGRRV